jgi:hypothetical protein
VTATFRAYLLAALIVFALGAGLAYGNSQLAKCAGRPVVIERLKALYGEQHQFTLVGDLALIEVWLNSRTSTWTILNTATDGTTCVIAAGSGLIVDSKLHPPGNDL